MRWNTDVIYDNAETFTKHAILNVRTSSMFDMALSTPEGYYTIFTTHRTGEEIGTVLMLDDNVVGKVLLHFKSKDIHCQALGNTPVAVNNIVDMMADKIQKVFEDLL